MAGIHKSMIQVHTSIQLTVYSLLRMGLCYALRSVRETQTRGRGPEEHK